MRRFRGNLVEVGNPHGLIAVYCDESEAIEIADMYPYPDSFRAELLAAVERAYPKESAAGAGPQ